MLLGGGGVRGCQKRLKIIKQPHLSSGVASSKPRSSSEAQAGAGAAEAAACSGGLANVPVSSTEESESAMPCIWVVVIFRDTKRTDIRYRRSHFSNGAIDKRTCESKKKAQKTV